MTIEAFNVLLSLGTLVLAAVTLALVAAYIFRIDIGISFGTWGVWIGLFALLGGVAVTLIHSGLYKLPPCPLCYWQRIFLYPQVALFGLGIIRRASGEARRILVESSLVLSCIGLGIALYHHALQMFPGSGLPCPANGSVSCAQIFYLEFGFLTYPLMAAALFSFIIVLMLFVRRSRA